MKLRRYLPLLFLFLMSAAHAQVVLFQLDKVTFEALYENPETFHNLDWEAHPHWRFVDVEFAKKHLQSDTLEASNYMIASLKELQLELRFTVIGGFYPFIIKNAHQPYLAFADREGNLVADVVIMRSRKGKLRKHKNTPFFYIRARNYKHISLQNDSLAQQWSIQFENITPEESYDNSWQQDKNTGYVVTNRGDFRHNDTLKVKAYLLHEKNHPVNQPVKVTLHQKNSWNAPIASWIIPPKKPGVFLLETILSDSLPLNEAYYINFNIDKNRSNFYSTALSARFYLSDYEVQEAKIEMESPHRLEISGEEDLVCHIQLMDGASLPIANATVSVQAKPSLTYIIPGGKKQLSLPSILQMEELATDANGVATFTIAKNQLQFEHHVSVAILAQAWLPNGQKLERNLNFSIDPKLVNPLATPIFVRKGDSLNVFMSNGSQETLALTETFSSFSRKKDILLPITFLSNPNIQSYQWRLGEQEGFISNSIIQPIQFTQQDKKGAIEVRMQNPYGLYTCVSFTNGKSIAATFFTQHKDTVFSIPARIGESTLIEWSYINGGELESKKQEMYLSNRTLTIQSNLTDTIFPGRTDSIEIQVA
ncbi:MAG: hypothetical protein LAT76_09905, partial [Schleiferiaceae bacterium]|nr:hypothetical protein [Schleiferiaceae bacterium]